MLKKSTKKLCDIGGVMNKSAAKPAQKGSAKVYFKRYWQLYAMLLLPLIYFIVFKYIPMQYIQIAWKDYKLNMSVWDMPVTGEHGLKYFNQAFHNMDFWYSVRNTLLLNLLDLVIGFPAPIILALLLNEVKNATFKKVVQTITYFPHFISAVVICGMVRQFCLTDGLFNIIGGWFGLQPKSLLQIPENFRMIFTLTNIWQGVGWASIIYLAAIAGVDTGLYEAAALDGAGRFQRIWHITLPGIRPTIIIMLIMRIGSLMNVGYEKIILLY